MNKHQELRIRIFRILNMKSGLKTERLMDQILNAVASSLPEEKEFIKGEYAEAYMDGFNECLDKIQAILRGTKE